MDKQQLQTWIEEYLNGTEYELVTLEISAENDILVEVDRLEGVDVDFCAELNRYLVEKIEKAYPQEMFYDRPLDARSSRALHPEGKGGLDYSLEVGSVSLTAPFKTKMQFQKNLGHDVEVMVSTKGQSTKYKGQLVSVDEETFSVDCEEKVGKAVTGDGLPVTGGKPKRPKKQIVTHTWRYDEPKYVKYDLKF